MFKIITSHLQSKLIIAFILVLLVPTTAIGVYAINSQTNSLIDQARAGELASSRSVSANITNLFNRAVPDLLYLANTQFIQDYTTAVLNGNLDGMNTLLRQTPEVLSSFSFPSYAGIYDQVRLLDDVDQEVMHVD